jgi:hypothetical protein
LQNSNPFVFLIERRPWSANFADKSLFWSAKSLLFPFPSHWSESQRSDYERANFSPRATACQVLD